MGVGMFARGCVHTSVHAHSYRGQSTIIHTAQKEVPGVTHNGCGCSTTRYEEWDSNRQPRYEHRDIENRTKIPSRRHLLSYTLKCLSERRIPTAWKNAKMVIIFRRGNKKHLKNYRPIYMSTIKHL